MNSIKFACDGVTCTAEVAACVGPVAVLRGTGTDSGRWFARGAFGARSFRAEDDARSLAAYYAQDAEPYFGTPKKANVFRHMGEWYWQVMGKVPEGPYKSKNEAHGAAQRAGYKEVEVQSTAGDDDMEYDYDAAPEFHTGEATPERNQRARLDQLEKRYDLGGLGPEELAEYRHLRELVSSDDEFGSEDDWSPEARAAAVEARKKKSMGGSSARHSSAPSPGGPGGKRSMGGSGSLGQQRNPERQGTAAHKKETFQVRRSWDDDPQLALSNRGVDADPKKRAERLLQEIIDSTSDSDIASQAQRAYMRGDFKTVERIADSLGVSGDAPVSEAQRRAMGAAMSGHSNLGIPKSVGKEFIDKDPGGALPSKAGDADPDERERRLVERRLERSMGFGRQNRTGGDPAPPKSYGGQKKTTFDPEFERAHPQTSRPDKYGSFRGGGDAALHKRQVEAQRAAMLERGVLCP